MLNLCQPWPFYLLVSTHLIFFFFLQVVWLASKRTSICFVSLCSPQTTWTLPWWEQDHLKAPTWFAGRWLTTCTEVLTTLRLSSSPTSKRPVSDILSQHTALSPWTFYNLVLCSPFPVHSPVSTLPAAQQAVLWNPVPSWLQRGWTDAQGSER